MTTHTDVSDAFDPISARLRDPNYRTWRAQVEASGGCAAPIHLTGSSRVLDRDGAVLIQREGDILAPCGNRRATVCPACSDRYAGDAFHLIRAGLAGDPTKRVPTTVTGKPRAFLTLTAPSFGPVHTRRTGPRAQILPCGCGEWHHPDDPRLGAPLDPDAYDYVGAVLWQAHAGALWHRFTIALRRALATALGIPVRAFRDHARLSYAKVAEYQRRGLVHFHAVLRLDGPDGPADPAPTGLTGDVLRDVVRLAARTATLTVTRPDGTPLVLGWGRQLDLRTITPAHATHLEDQDGEITDAALAGYIAKYATKGTGASETADRPIRDVDHVQYLDVSPHHARMIRTCWELGGLAQYEELGLRRWAHMLGFRGHFLTKSQRYSTTFGALRADRRTWRLVDDLAQLDRDTDDPNEIPLDLSTVTVINDWRLVQIGHHTYAERELAVAIAERNRQQRRTARMEAAR
ncbi:replication initiator [Pseudonocardia xinjiangensis]|uniref:Replication initiation protein n=1 Tax=Pseudonocardia xinjiangensis TaxID=75289 RepID=A0ABX1RH03_9PSEU|nr:replication initiator [Pseudonocardia xinjiangensis]NMH79663.1 replication initiation protein [Pseudonocardia xinjiangensis]